jgi:hypothetical protein
MAPIPMAKSNPSPETPAIITELTQNNFFFRGIDPQALSQWLNPEDLATEKLYSSRPIYTAFRPNQNLEFLYVLLAGGPVIVRSTPLDRILAITYTGSCFGMRNLPIGFGAVSRSFPSLVEAYKTTDVLKIPVATVQQLYDNFPSFAERYNLSFELREKFHYHLLNCSTYPPQAVASLLRALIYQERTLENQPQKDGTFTFDLPIDLIAHACQLNHRTVEQVLKGMTKVGLIKTSKATEGQGDPICVLNPEGLKEVYSATRDKVSWWPLK